MHRHLLGGTRAPCLFFVRAPVLIIRRSVAWRPCRHGLPADPCRGSPSEAEARRPQLPYHPGSRHRESPCRCTMVHGARLQGRPVVVAPVLMISGSPGPTGPPPGLVAPAPGPGRPNYRRLYRPHDPLTFAPTIPQLGARYLCASGRATCLNWPPWP